jgi:hypothetical protein
MGDNSLSPWPWRGRADEQQLHAGALDLFGDRDRRGSRMVAKPIFATIPAAVELTRTLTEAPDPISVRGKMDRRW